MANQRKLSERFRPQFLFTLDQIAFILRIENEKVFEYVHSPYSKSPPGKRMQSIEIVNFSGAKELRVTETELDNWAKRARYSGLMHLV